MKIYSLAVADVARILGVSARQVYDMAEKRELTHLRTTGNVSTRIVRGKRQTYTVSGRLRFAQEDVQAWIDEHTVTAASTAAPAPAATTPLDPLPLPARRRFAR